RNELLDAEQGISETDSAIRESVINQLIGLYIPAQSIEEQWDVPGLEKALASEFLLRIPVQEWLEADSELHEENLRSRIMESVNTSYQGKVEQVGASIMNQYERMVMLHSIDSVS
ncbi:hypothetical protein SQ11_16150, partial [Nitrosospira sp. NpAV]